MKAIIKGVEMANYIELAEALTTNFVECVIDREEADMVDIVLNPHINISLNHGTLNLDLGGRLAALSNEEYIEVLVH